MLRDLNRSLLLLFAINIGFGLTMQLINPLFPLYLDELGATEVQNALVISIGGLAATLLMLPIGLLIDRVSKKTMLILSTVVAAVSIYLMSQVGSWTKLIPFYIIFSMGGALFIPTRMALIAESATPQNRATLFGVMNLAWPVSGIVAPVLSGLIIENMGWSSVFLISAGISAVSAIPALLMVDPNKKTEMPMETVATSKPSLLDSRYLPTLVLFFLFHFALTTGLGGVNMIIPLYLKEVFNLSPTTIGFFFTGSSFITLFTQMPSGYLADRYGRKRLIVACISTIPLFYALCVFIDNWVVLFVLFSLAFGLWSMTWPATLALLSDAVPSQLRGAAFGVRMTSVRLGFTVGPIVASYLYGNYFPASPFVAAAILFALGIPLALLLKDGSSSETT